ncbi:MAG: class I adenylate cyclase [Proteobacteria bacterium]|nr:class I adenylate cyclase [Pseudomonadota bacterium]NOG61323.1 class I adenylate cyclase [Pseudomonadota bacterium]
MIRNLNQKSKAELYSAEAHFLKINKERIELTRQGLSERQARFIDLLPLLFHENNPELPGYINDDVPAGIVDYASEQAAIKAAKSFFNTYKPIRRARRIMDINGMYFMGSSGSIAYNSKSDFDVWLLHSISLDADVIDLIQQKAYAVEKWAEETLLLEVHFFIFSAEEFKQGKQQGLSSESSGSAQHYLLLDEFYRSSLLIAGKIPTWWLVPPENENDYENYIDDLSRNNKSSISDSIDFGAVADIPASEFFGAAVWQLYKSIHSPYKSLMKLLLMEVYASEYPSISLLSMMFKEAVYEGVENIDDLDPYLMMYKKVEEYLMIRNQRERLELFRQCFYVKINEPLSHEIKKKSWRRELFKQVVLDWGWTNQQFIQMDTQKNWQIDMISQQRNRLMNALTESYRFLSNFARQNTEVSRVSQTELNVLGRKLYAAFERRTGKIEIINRNNDASLNYSKLTIYQKSNSMGKDSWHMFQGHISLNDINETKPVKRAQNVMELLTWAFFNQIINSHSAISLINNDGLTVKELRQLLISLDEEFPTRKLPEADFNDLNQSAKIQHACVYINVGHVPKTRSNDNIKHISSTRDNVLSYGAQHNNLTHSFDLLICTTWEELLTFRFDGDDAFIQCICEYLNWVPPGETYGPPKLNAFSYSSSYGPAITKRIEEIIQDIVNVFYGKNSQENIRYLIQAEDCYYVLFNEDDHLHHKYIGSTAHLLRSLSKPNNKFSPVVFEHETHGDKLIQELFILNKPEKIQLFYFINNNMADIYIIDENASLFCQTIPFHDSEALINHFNLFFEATINRRVFLMLDIQSNIENIEVEFFQINYDKTKKIKINRINDEIESYGRGFFNIQVIGSPDDEHNSLSIFCEDHEFSYMEHGNNLFNVVAEYVINKRASGQKYPIYITDIDISKGLMGQVESSTLQTIHYLNYKKRIEDKLNQAIATY